MISEDSTGASIPTNRYFTVVLWAVANKTGTHAAMMINLPSGSYTTLTGATRDTDRFTNFNIPDEFNRESSTGFLVASFLLRNSTDMTLELTTDLRGKGPLNAGGSGGSGDVSGPSTATDEGVARWDGATGKIVQNSSVLISDGGAITGVASIAVSGNVDGRDVSVDGSKLDGIESGADVTDATNVNAAGAIMVTDATAKGDLIGGTAASAFGLLGVGSNDDVLTADSAEATGMK